MSWKDSFVKVPNKRILLTEEDFTTLVSGNILVKDGVEIALQDIGFRLMKQIIDRQDGGGTMTVEELNTLTSMFAPPPTPRRTFRDRQEIIGRPLTSFDSLGDDELDDLDTLNPF